MVFQQSVDFEICSGRKACQILVELKDDQESYERILGVQWNLSEGRFQFQVCLKDKPVTRRGMLFALSSLFDSLGFVAPIFLTARLILQDLCCRKLGWDEGIPEEDARKWRSWLGNLTNLSQVTIPHCVVRSGNLYSTLEKRELHFADASLVGYKTVSYLRVVGLDGFVFCSFILGKARLAPLKKVSIPKLELTAATMATTMDSMLRAELHNTVTDSLFWTDSLVALFIIRNSSKRFPVFAANRLIPDQRSKRTIQMAIHRWGCESSRCQHLTNEQRRTFRLWLSGPSFLQESQSN